MKGDHVGRRNLAAREAAALERIVRGEGIWPNDLSYGSVSGKVRALSDQAGRFVSSWQRRDRCKL
jgi:hypothetical protein